MIALITATLLAASCGSSPIETQTAIVPTQPAQIIAKEDGNVALTAFEPADMPKCQEALIAWCQDKVKTLRSDARELRQAYNQAKEKKWKTSVLKRHADLAAARVQFYEKILAALEAGYVIVPNFPVQAFAIRTKETIDAENEHVRIASYRMDFKREPDQSAVGEGEYQNPFPFVVHWQADAQSPAYKGQKEIRQYPHSWDKLDFPISMAKLEIMEATDRAMALKVFDQLGILPANRKEDPIIVGQIFGPKGKMVTFMIAWHLDTRTL